MFFIPLSQIESVDLVIHALRVAGGQADCTSCPARKVCMKQCLTIADAVTGMVETGTLPSAQMESGKEPTGEETAEGGPESEQAEPPQTGAKNHLKLVK